MSDLMEVYRQHRTHLNKYHYFLLAAAAAAIGFALQQTSQSAFELSVLPLGLAVLCWGISFYCGCCYLKHLGANLYANLAVLQVDQAYPDGLVTHDAKARQEMVAAHDRLNAQLNEQRAVIDAGRDELERERRQIAQQRHRDPILAAAVQNLGLIIACTLPLIVCIFVIKRMSSREPDDAAVAELLVHELVTDQPRFLPGPSLRPPALEHHAGSDSEPAETTDPGS